MQLPSQFIASPDISSDCPCTGHCTTVLGDEVCRSCLRTFDEVTRWPQMNEKERCAVNRRIVLECVGAQLIATP